MSELKAYISNIGHQAAEAASILRLTETAQKDAALKLMAEALEDSRSEITLANQEDLAEGHSSGLTSALLDRLELNDKRMNAMIQGVRDVAELPDPVGSSISTSRRPNGLEINKVRVPIGVIGIIYESRPNVTADASALCLKTSNAVILRGGKEALRSNQSIAKALRVGVKSAGLPENAIQFVETIDREAVKELVQMTKFVNLIIPRGGEGLISAVTKLAHVPVIKHDKGLCHTYVDKEADLEKALNICENAKVQRPGVCNAMETLLVHEAVAAEFLPELVRRLKPHSVELRGDKRAKAIVPDMFEATEEDWQTEYLELILSVKVVDDVDEAIAHINHYGSQHSDAIVSRSRDAAQKFQAGVDSATVYVNASTRFTDGAQFGLGAEIGISTDKLHARGPMGLEELTTYKYIIQGEGQIVE